MSVALRSGHCTKLKPEYEAASEQLKGVAKLVAVDATAAQGLAQQFGIEGFPTIKVFPKGKKNVKKFEDYNVRPTRLTGPRSLRCGCLATIWALFPTICAAFCNDCQRFQRWSDMSCVHTFVLPALTVVAVTRARGRGVASWSG